MSDKEHVNLSIDRLVLAKMRERVESVSAFCEDAMRADIDKNEVPITPEIIAELNSTLAKADETEIKLAELKVVLLARKKRIDDAALLGKYDDVLELRGVTPEQLANGAFASSLVDVIRAKYPDRPGLQRCDIRDLREYVNARDAYFKKVSE